MCLSGDYWKIIDVYLVIIRNCRKEGRKEEEKGHIYNRPKGLASSIKRQVGRRWVGGGSSRGGFILGGLLDGHPWDGYDEGGSLIPQLNHITYLGTLLTIFGKTKGPTRKRTSNLDSQ